MDYSKMMEEVLNEVCCDFSTGNQHVCDNSRCLVGFSKKCLGHYITGRGPRIQNGRNDLPSSDMKFYEKEDAAKIIAIACKMCRNCHDDHSEDCVVSLCRRAMEYGTMGKELDYKGSSLVYLKELEENNFELNKLVMIEFKQLDQ